MRKGLWLVLWLVAGICSPAAEPSLEFVHISDSHLMRLSGVHPKVVAAREHYRASDTVLVHVLERLALPPVPDFVLHTGDIVDAYCFDGLGPGAVYGQIELFKAVIGRSPVPVFLALGNHDLQRYRAGEKGATGDFSVAVDARREWRNMFPVFRDGTYYGFRKHVGSTTYRFLVLDNGEPEARNPGFYSRQLNWLQEQVAEVKEGQVILAMHIPLSDDKLSTAIKEIVGRASNVVLAIGGHRHSDAIEEIDVGTRKLVQVRTAILATSEEHTRFFRLFEDRVEIAATGHPGQLEKSVRFARTAAVARSLSLLSSLTPMFSR